MAFTSRPLHLAGLLAVFLGCHAGVLSPALAADDGQDSIIGSIMGMVSLDAPKGNGDIAYRERPPLVLPPKMQLRQPQPAAAERTAAWPQDVEQARRKKENEKDFNLVKSLVGDQVVTREDLQKDALAKQSAPRDRCESDVQKANCQRVNWSDLAGDRIVDPNLRSVAPGVEPPRKALTDPPRGYRAPTKIVKETAIAPQKAESTNPLFFWLPKKQDDE